MSNASHFTITYNQEWIEDLKIDDSSLSLRLFITSFAYFELDIYQRLVSATIIEVSSYYLKFSVYHR